MIYYAIRHKPTGHFLPPIPASNHNGSTWSEPSPGIPRLFAKRSYAKIALDWWLKGKYSQKYIPGHTWEDDGYVKEKTTPVPERKAEEMEIVEIELRIRP